MNKFNQTTLAGSLVLSEEEFAWKFENGRGIIVSHDYSRITNIVDDGDIIKHIQGKSGEYSIVHFIDCKIINRLNIYFIPKAIIIFNQFREYKSFDSLKFEGSFLNDLYDPIKHSFEETNTENIIETLKEGTFKTKIKSFNDTDIDFEGKYEGHRIDFSFNTTRIVDSFSKKRFEEEVNTFFRCKFEEALGIESIINLYDIMIIFFRLLLFTNSFSFNKLILCNRDTNGKLFQVGELIINSNYLTNKENTARFQDLTQFKDKLSSFYKIAVERHTMVEKKANMSVDNFIGDKVVANPNFSLATSQDLTDVAMSFEHYYERLYTKKGIGIKKTDFEKKLNKNLVDFIQNLLDQKEEVNKKSQNKIRGKDRDLAKKYKVYIARIDTNLESKIRHICSEFPAFFKVLCTTYASQWSDNKVNNIPKYFADYRNKLLHGTYVDMSQEINVSYSIVRILVYALLLHEVGFPESEIIDIFNNFYKVFLNT